MTLRPRRVLLAVLVAALASCSKPAAAPPAFERPPAPVRVATAVARDVPVYLDEIGRVVAKETVRVRAQVTARIEEARFTDGADLKKGDVLFVLDARPFQAHLDAGEAALLRARTSVAKAQAAALRPRATLARAKASLELARSEFSRVERLVETKAVSRSDFDEKKSAVAMAEAEVQQAEAEVSQTEPAVAEAEAEVKMAEAEVASARIDVEYCTIRCPIDGRAGQRLVDPGNLVAANGDPLVMVERMDEVYVDFTVAEDRLRDVRTSAASGPPKVEVRIPGETGDARAGAMTFVDSQVDRTTGTLRLRATLANEDRALWPGRFVKVRLVLATLGGATLVPAVAEQHSPTGPFVYVVGDGDTAEMRPAKVGQKHDGLVVLEGVRAGERVVVEGQLGVTPGGKVHVVADAPSPAAPASAAGR